VAIDESVSMHQPRRDRGAYGHQHDGHCGAVSFAE
jgi:hypothetical protein